MIEKTSILSSVKLDKTIKRVVKLDVPEFSRDFCILIIGCFAGRTNIFKDIMNIKDIEHNVKHAANLLKALSNEKRLSIVCALYEGEKSVGALEEFIGLSQSALSQHLARLRRDNLVQTRREAQTIYYMLSDRTAESILRCLYSIYCPEHDQESCAVSD